MQEFILLLLHLAHTTNCMNTHKHGVYWKPLPLITRIQSVRQVSRGEKIAEILQLFRF